MKGGKLVSMNRSEMAVLCRKTAELRELEVLGGQNLSLKNPSEKGGLAPQVSCFVCTCKRHHLHWDCLGTLSEWRRECL